MCNLRIDHKIQNEHWLKFPLTSHARKISLSAASINLIKRSFFWILAIIIKFHPNELWIILFSILRILRVVKKFVWKLIYPSATGYKIKKWRKKLKIYAYFLHDVKFMKNANCSSYNRLASSCFYYRRNYNFLMLFSWAHFYYPSIEFLIIINSSPSCTPSIFPRGSFNIIT